MIATGLLWYDDDTRRSLAQKLADAADRYRERVGFEPTTCQLNPTLIPTAPPAAVAAGGQTRRARARIRTPEPAISLHLIPDEHLRPNYFFVGIEAGEPALRVPGWRNEDSDDYDRAPRSMSKSAKSKIAAKPATASMTAPRSADVTAAHPINVEKPAKTATAPTAANTTGTQKAAESATAYAPLSAHAVGAEAAKSRRAGVGAQPAAPSGDAGSISANSATAVKSPLTTTSTKAAATATPTGPSWRQEPTPKSIRTSDGRPHARALVSQSNPPARIQKPAETATAIPGKNGNRHLASPHGAHAADEVVPPPSRRPVPPSDSRQKRQSPRATSGKNGNHRSGSSELTAESATATKPARAATTQKPAKTATAPITGKLALIPPRTATKSKVAMPSAQPASSTKIRKAEIAAKTATVISPSPSPSPHPSRSRKTTIAAESATTTPAKAPIPSTRARKAAKTATASQPSPRRRASRRDATQARVQPPASIAANAPTTTAPSKRTRTPAKAALAPLSAHGEGLGVRSLAPAQATLWGDAPAPAHPNRKRRSA